VRFYIRRSGYPTAGCSNILLNMKTAKDSEQAKFWEDGGRGHPDNDPISVYGWGRAVRIFTGTCHQGNSADTAK
jgi:hypothetical protein